MNYEETVQKNLIRPVMSYSAEFWTFDVINVDTYSEFLESHNPFQSKKAVIEISMLL